MEDTQAQVRPIILCFDVVNVDYSMLINNHDSWTIHVVSFIVRCLLLNDIHIVSLIIECLMLKRELYDYNETIKRW